MKKALANLGTDMGRVKKASKYARLLAGLKPDEVEYFEEYSAVFEYCKGFTRQRAEELALEHVLGLHVQKPLL